MSYSRFSPGKHSLFIDWETTGADFDQGYDHTFEKYQGISLGLVVADNETLEEVDSKYVLIKWNPKYEWTAGAEKVHGLTQEFLEENGVDQEEALADIIEFMLPYFGDSVFSPLEAPEGSAKVCLGGHNIDFDIAATQALFKLFGLKLHVHHVKLETSGASFIAIGEYRSNVVFEFFNGEVRGKHNALDDARLALGAARGIKQLVKAALEG
jgi:hypothetical protein